MTGVVRFPASSPASKDALPKGKIGGLEVSRLVLGGSPLQHYVHCRDLGYIRSLLAHYNTPEKILQTLAVAEQQGINTLVCHPSGPAGNTVDLLKRHREKHGGKMPWIAFKVLAAGAIPPQDAFRHAFENGADFILAGMYDFEIAEDVSQMCPRTGVSQRFVFNWVTCRRRDWPIGNMAGIANLDRLQAHREWETSG